MQPISRRTALAGAVTALAATPSSAKASQDDKKPELTRDQQFVMEAGMTEAEARCWKLTAEAAGSFFALPELHPMDKQEVATAIHVLQNKLLGRPTYRKYLKLAKAAHAEKPKGDDQE